MIDELAPLTSREVAKIMHVTIGTVTRWTREGFLPYFTTPVGAYNRYRRSDIERIIQERTKLPTNAP